LDNLISSNISQPCNFHPFQQIWKSCIFFAKALDIQNLGCTRHDEMYAFVLFCFQSFTLGCSWKLCLPHPRSMSINHCCSQKNMQVTWLIWMLKNLNWTIGFFDFEFWFEKMTFKVKQVLCQTLFSFTKGPLIFIIQTIWCWVCL
jgi:hypothetical protein